ncbi:MAG: DUF2141 domain-containing protein [Saprospiraceae bacterium]|nr:DUF2141 domain-containing protein [Saprospiraceae bacterium]
MLLVPAHLKADYKVTKPTSILNIECPDYMHMFSILFLVCATLLAPEPTAKGTLKIKIDNVEPSKGTIHIAIYKGEKNFLVEDEAMLVSAKVNDARTQEILVPDLPFGEYAFAIFQDLNENKELDTNLVGIPKEPFAFSGIPESRFREPYYKEVKFNFEKDGQIIPSRLDTFW